MEHPVFKRKGDDLHITQNLTLRQALLGFEIEKTHLDGHKFELKKSRGQVTQPGEKMKIKEEGMPKYGMSSENGDLIVTFEVSLPEKLDEGQKALLK